ncbi:hypothetical protein SEA_HANS_38 [Gordonia phage Hans]|nr:hypothetical protein SEA_HANS_38 [Gordonia phage Hans]
MTTPADDEQLEDEQPVYVTADDVAAFHDAGGGYWWLTNDGKVMITKRMIEGARRVYLMPWDQAWFDQWGGDWAAAADQLNTLIGENLSAQ